jgi:hypothetical protein
MREEFLHYLWKYSLYDADQLIDNEGNRIEVIHPGEHNTDSGPDFFNARLRIGDTHWAGNVEIHLKASHFNLHSHNTDPAYDNVILHLVSENDKPVFNSRGQELLTIVPVYDKSIYNKYNDLINKPFTIACTGENELHSDFRFRIWLTRMVVERLEQKSVFVKELLGRTSGDWEETLYRMLSRYFGFRVNTDPFERLAALLPSKIIRKHADNRTQVEALLYGTAGMLDAKLFREAVGDKYYSELLREYAMLSAKYGISTMEGWLWKFSRLRPANFPTIRISQLAALMCNSEGLFSRVVDAPDLKALKILLAAEAGPYWNDHYVFGKPVKGRRKKTGDLATDILIINAVVPVLFTYGQVHGRQLVCDRALSLLESVDPEDNRYLREWKAAGIDAASAFWSQGLLHLYRNYCMKRRCLDCETGIRLVGRKSVTGV